MSWMSPNMKMETTSNGGIGKAFGRMFAGEAIFQNRYTAMGGNGMIAFASSFPGSILGLPDRAGPGADCPEIRLSGGGGWCRTVCILSEKAGRRLLRRRGLYYAETVRCGTAFLEFDGHVIVRSSAGTADRSGYRLSGGNGKYMRYRNTVCARH